MESATHRRERTNSLEERLARLQHERCCVDFSREHKCTRRRWGAGYKRADDGAGGANKEESEEETAEGVEEEGVLSIMGGPWSAARGWWTAEQRKRNDNVNWLEIQNAHTWQWEIQKFGSNQSFKKLKIHRFNWSKEETVNGGRIAKTTSSWYHGLNKLQMAEIVRVLLQSVQLIPAPTEH